MKTPTGLQIVPKSAALAFWLIGFSTGAHAQFASGSVFEFWRNERQPQAGHHRLYDPHTGPRYGRGYYGDARRALPYWERPPYRIRPYYRGHDDLEPRHRSFGRQAPQVEVESPQYYTYAPDDLKIIRFDRLCELEIASSTETVAAPIAPTPVTGLFAQACAFAPSIALRMLPAVGQAINDYYTQHAQFVWLDGGQVTAKARAAMAFLAGSDRIGLLPAEYRVALPHADDKSDGARLQALMRFELDLSSKVLTYVLDATRGRVDPNRISGYHDLPRKSVDLVGALEEITRSQDVAGYLEQRNPNSAQFRSLVAELARLRNAAAQPGIVIAENTFIRPGESDRELANVIAAIRQTGSAALRKRHAKALAGTPDAETYTEELVSLVRDFQSENGLKADGIIGENTIRAMTRDSTADKIRKVRLALERLRWLPQSLGDRYVFLNQPAFEVTYVDGGREQLSMRAIIGKKSSQTFFFTDQIATIEYNPSWGVPRSIVINEMLPKLYRDPSYLDRLGYEVTTRSGRRVSSRYVDWSRVAHDKLSVSVRQPPGEDNALGQIKIDFPNKHAIYMHDTPHKALFKKERRAFSHGCVRLQHPRVLAAAILYQSVDYVDSRIAAGHSRSEQVHADIPVYLAYFTAWPDAQGIVRYYDDVYERDQYLSRALEKTQQARSAN